MKRLISLAAILLALPIVLTQTASAAECYYEVKMTTPFSTTGGRANTRTFNVEYTTLSVDQNEEVTVKLFQNEVLVGTQTTTKDFGDSGAFNITVPSDGSYDYHMLASSGLGCPGLPATPVKNVSVDTSAPTAVNYTGKTRNNNSYTLNFTAPATGDVTTVAIYASTSNQFTAGPATLVGTVNVTPGQAANFVYNAPDAAQRFFALRAFDAHGNGSGFAADQNVVVVAAAGGGLGAGGAQLAAAQQGGAGAGQVAGAQEGAAGTEGTVSDDAAVIQNTEGEVLGAEATGAAQSSNTGRNVGFGVAILALLAGAYYWFIQRAGKGPFAKADK